MNTHTIRQSFLDFYKERGHNICSSSSLIPPDENDPVLFVTSGMHPLIPYLKGESHPQGTRLVNSQRCLRTTDLEEVGDSTHLTGFEMLGTWSLGDYSHSQSLRWGWELLTKVYGIDPSLLHVTVFEGDERCGPDDESYRTWLDIGLTPEQITKTVDDNWWTGPDGMCGPDSEIFMWSNGVNPPSGNPVTDGHWVEIWNHVSMQYQVIDDVLTELPIKCVDTGMGLERLSMLLQGQYHPYYTDMFDPITDNVEMWYNPLGYCLFPISDHLRCIGWIVQEGIYPSNTGRGYVLRRLIRRSLIFLWKRTPGESFDRLEDSVFSFMTDGDEEQMNIIRQVIHDEEVRYIKLIERGRKIVSKHLSKGPITDEIMLDLYQTHGLPEEIVKELQRDIYKRDIT